jgi:tetratricopeptide (TPR) repeat protein
MDCSIARGGWLLPLAFLACALGQAWEKPLDQLPDNDMEVIKASRNKPKPKNEAQQKGEAIKYHIKNLTDKDPEIRQTSAQMLGQLNAVEAVPNLIETLKDDHVYVAICAHGSLNKITGKNFGYANYKEWKGWWEANQQELIEKKAVGVSDISALRAKASNSTGLLHLENGDCQQAYRMFLDAVNANPKVPDYRNNLGLAVMELAKSDPYRYIDAMHYFQEALGLDDSLPQPYMNIGSCYAHLGKHIEAQAWFRKAISKDVNGMLWEYCWSLGKELLAKGDFHLAVEYLEQARSKAERSRKFDPRVYRDLALGYYGLDQYHSAFREIMNLKRLGYDPNPEFEEKVRKALKDQGVDPEKEDEAALEEQRRMKRELPAHRPPPSDTPSTSETPAEAQPEK